jgi:hypothetical protein
LPRLSARFTIATVTGNTSLRLTMLVCTAVLTVGPLVCAAQTVEGERRNEPMIHATGTVDGRSFSGIALPVAIRPSSVQMKADAIWSWRESGTRRLFLRGDVEFDVGGESFNANRGVVWVQPIAVPGRTIYQVAVYFDRVESPLAAAGISHEALGLLITAAIEGEITVSTDVMREGRPDDPFIAEGERRLAAHLTIVLNRAPELPLPEPVPEDETRTDQPPPPVEWGTTVIPREDERESAPPYRDPDRSKAIFARDGIVTFDAEDLYAQIDDEGTSVMLTGGVMFQYMDIDPRTNKRRDLVLTADRAVIFLRGRDASMATGSMRAGEVRGIYLEGNVEARGSVSGQFARTPTDASYTLRGPYMYYDVEAQRALVMEAVFSTFDKKIRQPIYVRASALRQEAVDQWSADRATVANSTFFVPHFSLGASRVTVRQEEERQSDGGTRTANLFRANDITFKAGHVPFFYWPMLEGELEDIPLRQVSLSDSRNMGFSVRTEWNAFSLFGAKTPDNLDAELQVDWSEHRGVGLGLDVDYQWRDGRGEFFTYYINDRGRDRFSNGQERDRPQDNRGMFVGRHRQLLSDEWLLITELAYISDPAFLDSFFREMPETEKEFETVVYLKRQRDNAAFDVLAKPDLIDFTPNEYLLQSQGYQVEKLPEAGYYRFADELGPDLRYSMSATASRMRLSLTDVEPREIGLRYPAWSRQLFGAEPDQSLADRFRQLGYTENFVHRFDTRHELTLPFAIGPIRFLPFLTGRFTAYDDDFEEFGGNDDMHRMWGAVGIRISTILQHVDDRVESRLLGLHRLRHLIEPSLTAWQAWTSMDASDLPVYDVGVESLEQGGAIRFGLRNTWQTQRGGPGRWRSVDVLTVDTNLVLVDDQDDGERQPLIGRFYDYRPEYSVLSDHATADAVWLVSDSFAVSGNMIFNLDENKAARWSAGYELRHSPAFTSFLEGRFVDALDTTLVDLGAAYELTHRYRLGTRVSYDTDEDDIRDVRATLARRAPQWTLFFTVNYDNIRNETSFSVELSPSGTRQRFGVDSRDLES